jgi:hypothetical protein
LLACWSGGYDHLIAFWEPEDPILRPHHGGGSRRDWRQQYWLSPLPPPGELLFACEWPAIELELATATIDAGVLLDAVTRGSPIWPAAGPHQPDAI